MASVQERMQLKRLPLDSWSLREKLCLASAVSCSGDQNWKSVSRSLKMLCGSNRPNDWFSQKSCAVQYGELLENAETPKRKKRCIAERDSQALDTPTESILRKLTQERIAELKAQIKKDQEEYLKLREEILLVQSSEVTESQLYDTWADIELEQEQKTIEQQKHNQWLKEREEKKLELQKTWRPTGFPSALPSQSPQRQLYVGCRAKSEEREIEVTQSPKHGTAPLLTSLLKSPSPAPNSTASTSHATANTVTNVRMTAPTITNLLTGSNTNQLTSIIRNQQYHPVNTQPLTGPAPTDQTQQIAPTPSQAAPTLSMLLDNKNKECPEQPSEKTVEGEVKQENEEAMDTEDVGSPNKDDEQQLMEVLNGLIPDSIDELADILTSNNEIILNPELLEEESILEGVESLVDEQDEGNNDEVINKEGEVSNSEANELRNSPESTEAKTENGCQEIQDTLDSNKICEDENKPSQKVEHTAENVKENVSTSETSLQKDKISEGNDYSKKEKVVKTEVSDDSSDNTCLQSIKEKIQEDMKNEKDLEVKQEIENDVTMESEVQNDNLSEENKVIKNEDNLSNQSVEEVKIKTEDLTEAVKNENIEEVSKSESTESSDVIIIQEDDDSIEEKSHIKKANMASEKDIECVEYSNKECKQEIEEKEEILLAEIDLGSAKISSQPFLDEDKSENDIVPMLNEATTTITIIDTDDDLPIEVVKEDKSSKNKRDYSRKRQENTSDKKVDEIIGIEENKQNLNIRKLKEREGSESPLVEDDNTDSLPRTRRRYSSTPVIDSIPSSPASSDDREYKAWKKSIFMIYNRIIAHKHASIFLRPVTEEVAPNYKGIVLRPMDLQTIKKNIENGVVRTTTEFQRDVMLMCQNAIMYNKKDNNVYNMAKEMMTESVAVIESLIENVKRENEKYVGSNSVFKSRGRKSHRLP